MVITDLSNGNNVGERVDISPGIIGTLIASRKREKISLFTTFPDLQFASFIEGYHMSKKKSLIVYPNSMYKKAKIIHQ